MIATVSHRRTLPISIKTVTRSRNSDEMQKIAERFGVANISDRVRNITLARRDKGMTTQA
jgi:hypothetical protein